MRRSIMALTILAVIAALLQPAENSPIAEGGHAPGITMECDILSSEPLVTSTKFVFFDILNPVINDLIDLLLTTTYDSLQADFPGLQGVVPTNDEIRLFLEEIAVVHSNTLGYPMSDLELIFR